MIEVVKIGSKSCGSCGKMTHYDEKVTRELGYEWRNLEKGTDAYKYATDILNEVRKFFGRSIAFPTYAIYEDGKLVHAFMGATDKGTFRRRLQRETLNSDGDGGGTTPPPGGEGREGTGCSGACEAGDAFTVDKPDASYDNTIHFKSASGREFSFFARATGVYPMDFGVPNEVYDCWFTSNEPKAEFLIRIDNGGKSIGVEDQGTWGDSDFNDLLISVNEGVFSNAGGESTDHFTFTAGPTIGCTEGCACIENTCGGECGGPCPDGSQCIPEENRCEWVPVERNIIPACLQFQCCQNKCEEGRPDGNINIGDGDGDGLGDCDKRPTPDPVPGSNSKNQVYLYDRLNHTYIFCCPIKADVTWLLPFDTMPPVFQRYVTTTASVRVAAQMVNNPQLFQLLKDRENTLRMECMNYEMEQADLNFLNQPDHSTYMSYQTMQTLNR